MSSGEIPVVNVPVTVKQLAEILSVRVPALLALLTFRLKRKKLNVHAELGAEDVKDIVCELGIRVLLVVPNGD
jgi:hypothetical protein